MTKTDFKKVITLFSSLSLVMLFLLYRVGALDKFSFHEKTTFQSSHNGGSINPIATDSTKTVKDTTKALLTPTANTLTHTYKKFTLIDSTKSKKLKSNTEMLSSSKSGAIFSPKYDFKFYHDSVKIKFDTIKPKKKK